MFKARIKIWNDTDSFDGDGGMTVCVSSAASIPEVLELLEAQLQTARLGAPDSMSMVQLRLLSVGEKKITCIKLVRNLTGLGLKEAKQLVECAPVDLKTVSLQEATEWIHKFAEAGAHVKWV